MDRDTLAALVKETKQRNYLEAMIFAYDERERKLNEDVILLSLWALILGSMSIASGGVNLGRLLRNRRWLTKVGGDQSVSQCSGAPPATPIR
jgi:hypothetical protein